MHNMRSPATYGRGLPLPDLLPPVTPTGVYCVVTPIDARGRLADGSPVRVTGWQPGQPVAVTHRVHAECRVIDVRAGGPYAITRQGHVRIPAPIRHLCGIATGARLLVIATPERGLTLYPMSALADLNRRERR